MISYKLRSALTSGAIAVAGVLILLAIAPVARAADAPSKLNVLFIMIDDLRPELGCYGVSGIKTPNLDKLAKEGVLFERAYCQYPLCNPSRSSLLNGRYPTQTGVMENTTYFRDVHPDFVTLPQHFKNNGYATVRVGKIFHGGIDDKPSWTDNAEPNKPGTAPKPDPKVRQQNSDRIVVLPGEGESHMDFKTVETTISYLEKMKDRPFFIGCGFTKPHSPPTAPQRFFDMYDIAKVPLPVDFGPRPAAPAGFPSRSITPNGDLFINRDATQDQAREMKRAYWASATWTDYNVGRVIATLDKLGLREKTIILVWGDHGYHLSEKGKWSKHQSIFDTGAHVPLIVLAPKAAGNGKSSPRIVQTLDLYPTLVELCGLPKMEGLPGHTLTPLLKDPQAAWNYPAYTYGAGLKNPAISVRTDRWRYAEWDNSMGGAMLIDEQNDPNELKNLADDPMYASVRAEMKKLLNGMPGLAK